MDSEHDRPAAARLHDGTPPADAFDTRDPQAWLALDQEVREDAFRHGPASPSTRSLILRGSDPVDHGEASAALALCHRDGRVRERTLERAAAYPNLLPLVAIRCTDWVEPVRSRARQLLREALDIGTAVRLAPLLLLLGRRGRGAAGLALLHETLAPATAEQLAPLLEGTDRTARRFAHRLAVAQGLLPPLALARTTVRGDDTVVQNLCAEAAFTTAGPGEEDEVIATLLSARDPGVRSAGVTALRRSGRPEEAEHFLTDRSGLVRACARYVLRQHGTDPRALYLAHLRTPDDPSLPPAAAVGLAECGDRSDADLLRRLLVHPVPAVRARTVAGLRLLDSAEAGRLWPLLDDPSAAVVREVAVTLLPAAGELPQDALTERLGPGLPRHVRAAAFRLLHRVGGVVRLRAATALLDDPDARLRRRAEAAVQQWSPSEQVPWGSAEVGELLDRSGHLLSPYVLDRRKREAGLRS
ncbi:HEAT repeat domain-containing protein [Streptomyces sp. TR06-5]|uniref:HEAT repeat domain-containing protein n=1 Tax=Streptomyces sp. TR06-5 TaxID=3385976 RepID=UPI00399FB186